MAGVVSYVGDDERGNPVFDMPLTVPEPKELDPPPSQRMTAAIIDLFGIPLDLTGSQAHAVLCCRDYGRACVSRLMPTHPRAIRDLFSKLVLVYILADADRLADVLAWSHRRFDRQPDGAAIARTKRFADVSKWLSAQ